MKNRAAIPLLLALVLVIPLKFNAYAGSKQRLVVRALLTEGIDINVKRIAQDFTGRFRVNDKFELPGESEIDLAEDMLADKEREDENRAAAEIGRILRADKVIFGTVSRKKNGYLVAVNVLHVEAQKVEFYSERNARGGNDLNSVLDEIAAEVLNNIGIPDAPQNLASTKGESEILIRWRKVYRSDIYRIYRSRSEAGNYSEIGVTKQTEYRDSAADPGKKYHYRVAAVNSDGSSALSASDFGYVPKPLAGYYLRCVIPGWAQIHSGEKKKGFVMMGVFIAAGSLTIYSGFRYRDSRDEYYRLGPGNSRDEFDSKYYTYRNSAYLFLGMGIITASVVAINWIDALFLTKKEYERIAGDGRDGRYLQGLTLLYDRDGKGNAVFLAGLRARF